MKKIFLTIACIIMMLTLAGCEIYIPSDLLSNYDIVSTSSSKPKKEKNIVIPIDKNKSGSEEEKNSSATDTSSEKPSEQNSDNTSTGSTNKKQPTSSSKPSNFSDKTSNSSNPSSSVVTGETNKETEKIEVPQGVTNIDNPSEEDKSSTTNANAVKFEFDGTLVKWTTENDMLYILTKSANRLVVIDSNTFELVANVPLSGTPGEMNFVGENIYISLPSLSRIDIFSKSTYKKTSSLSFAHEISSFCVDGDYIFYSEHDQWCKIFRKNIATGEMSQLSVKSNQLFYFPKLLLNKEDNILYVGECKNSGCAIYYFDSNTLQLKSSFKKNNYGIMNHTRDIFHIGNDIFWGNFRLSDTDATNVIGQYGGADYGSINFASPDFVGTYEGLFITDTYECVINYRDTQFPYPCILITKSKNVFFADRMERDKIIIGVIAASE